MTDYDVYDHREIQASCLDLDVKGEYLALAGKRCVAVTKASDPESADFKFTRRNKFDVSCIKWCPRLENRQQMVAASSQFYEIYNLQQNGLQMMATGRAHSRNITDLDWDQFNSYQFATCSVDDSVNIWDVRDLKKPSLSLNIIAGAFQIKWCKLEHIFATAHEGDIRLWDTRKGSTPVQFIAAHLSKVLSFDWHHTVDVLFVSSSLDRTVKIFDFTKPNEPEVSFNTPSPVWRAKFVTFGDAVLTIPFPQVGRPEHSVTLWNTNDTPTVVHTFLGHTDLVLDFCLRTPPSPMTTHYSSSMLTDQSENGDRGGAGNGAVQLYTLCKDYALRLWTIDSKLQSMCGQKKNTTDSDLIVSNGSGHHGAGSINYNDFVETFERDVSFNENSLFTVNHAGNVGVNLEQEFLMLHSLIIPSVTIEEINVEDCYIMASVAHRRYIIRLTISLPKDNFGGKSPNRQLTFKFSRDSTVPNSVKIKILKQLQEICQQNFDDGQSMLEACLKRLPKCLEQYLSESESSDTQPSTASPNVLSITDLFTSYVNNRVPFPATCGARFCSADKLVCFARQDAPNANMTSPSPRSYAALLNHLHEPQSYFAVTSKDAYRIKSFYYPTQDWVTSRKKPRVDSAGLHYAIDKEDSDESCSQLLVYDFSGILSYSKDLAKIYRLNDNEPSEVCLANANAANSIGRKDLCKMWKILSRCTDQSVKCSTDSDSAIPWAVFPFGRKLVNQFIDYYCRSGDIQTAAVICCVLGSKVRYQMSRWIGRNSVASETLGGTSTYNTIHSADGIHEALASYFQRRRSGSFSEEPELASPNGYDLLLPISETKGAIDRGQDAQERNFKLLDPDYNEKYEIIKQAYADLLYRWNLLNERAEILKYSHRPPEKSRGIEYVTACRKCGSECRSAVCNDCKIYAMMCVVCKTPIKGLSSVCTLCTHGGHTSHLSDWFKEHDKCPSGCGCTCLYT